MKNLRQSILTKLPAIPRQSGDLKKEGILNNHVLHRQLKYHNNLIEADHGKLKRFIKPILGFKSMKTAYATIKGFEVMRMFRKGQLNIWTGGQGLTGEIHLIERQFDIYSAI